MKVQQLSLGLATPERQLKPYEIGKSQAQQLVKYFKHYQGDAWFLKLRHEEGATIQVEADGSLTLENSSEWPYKRYYIQSLNVEAEHLVFYCITDEAQDPRFTRDGFFSVQEWQEQTGYNEETRVRSFCLIKADDAVLSNWAPF
jgi:hypothetical protein